MFYNESHSSNSEQKDKRANAESENQDILKKLSRQEEIYLDQFNEQLAAIYNFKQDLKGKLGEEEAQNYKLKRSKYRALNVKYDKVKKLVKGSPYEYITDNILKYAGLSFDKSSRHVVPEAINDKVRIENNIKCFADPEVKAWTKHELNSMVNAGYLERCQASDIDCLCPIFTVDNGKKLRLVYDARAINHKFRADPFHLPGPLSPLMHESHVWFAKSDLSSAFYSIKLNKDMSRHFGVLFEGKFYRYTVLPFGWTCAPFLFTNWYSSILEGLYAQFKELPEIKGKYSPSDYAYWQYIDDVLYSGKDANVVNMFKTFMDNKLTELGLVVAVEKDVMASKSIEWLGFTLSARHLDLTKKARARLIQEIDRALKVAEEGQADSLKSIPHYSVNDHQHLLGIMGQFALLAPRARTLYVELMRAVNPEIRKQNAWKNARIPYQMSALEQENLRQLSSCIFTFPGYTLRVHDRNFEIFTDAAKEGAHCTLGICDKFYSHLEEKYSESFYQKIRGIFMDVNSTDFKAKYKGYLDMIHNDDIQGDGAPSIAVLEGLALLIAVKEVLHFNPKLSSVNLIVNCDNQIVVRSFQDNYSKLKSLAKFLQEAQTITKKRDVNLVVRYIQTKQNPADVFSRVEKTNGTWHDLYSRARYPVKPYEIIKYHEKDEIVVLSQFDNVLQQLQNKKTALAAFHEHKAYIIANILYLLGPKIILITKALIQLAMRMLHTSSRIDNQPEYRLIMSTLQGYNLFNETLHNQFLEKGSCTDLELESILSAQNTPFQEQLIEADLLGDPQPSIRNMQNAVLIKKKRHLNNFCKITVQTKSDHDTDSEYEGGQEEDGAENRKHSFLYYYNQPNNKSSTNQNAVKNAYHQSRKHVSHAMGLPDGSYFKERFLQEYQVGKENLSPVFEQPINRFNTTQQPIFNELADEPESVFAVPVLESIPLLKTFADPNLQAQVTKLKTELDEKALQLKQAAEISDGQRAQIAIQKESIKEYQDTNAELRSEMEELKNELQKQLEQNFSIEKQFLDFKNFSIQRVSDLESELSSQTKKQEALAQKEQQLQNLLEGGHSEMKGLIEKQEELNKQVTFLVAQNHQAELNLNDQIKKFGAESQEQLQKQATLLENQHAEKLKLALDKQQAAHDLLVQQYMSQNEAYIRAQNTDSILQQAKLKAQKSELSLSHKVIMETQVKAIRKQYANDIAAIEKARQEDREQDKVFYDGQLTKIAKRHRNSLKQQKQTYELQLTELKSKCEISEQHWQELMQQLHDTQTRCEQQEEFLVQTLTQQTATPCLNPTPFASARQLSDKKMDSSQSLKQLEAVTTPQEITVQPFLTGIEDNPEQESTNTTVITVPPKDGTNVDDYLQFLVSHESWMKDVWSEISLPRTAVEHNFFESKLNSHNRSDRPSGAVLDLAKLVPSLLAVKGPAVLNRLLRLKEDIYPHSEAFNFRQINSALQIPRLPEAQAGLQNVRDDFDIEALTLQEKYICMVDLLLNSNISLRGAIQMLDWEREFQSVVCEIQWNEELDLNDPNGVWSSEVFKRVLRNVVPPIANLLVQSSPFKGLDQQQLNCAVSQLHDFAFWYLICSKIHYDPETACRQIRGSLRILISTLYFVAKHHQIHIVEVSNDERILFTVPSELKNNLITNLELVARGIHRRESELTPENSESQIPMSSAQSIPLEEISSKRLKQLQDQLDSQSHQQPQASKKLGAGEQKYYNM